MTVTIAISREELAAKRLIISEKLKEMDFVEDEQYLGEFSRDNANGSSETVVFLDGDDRQFAVYSFYNADEVLSEYKRFNVVTDVQRLFNQIH